jgi:hypothetical protein
MTIFEKLALVTQTQSKDGELPDFIVPLLMKVAESPQDFTGREELVAELVERVDDYDPISNYCCEKLGFNLADIHTTLDKLRVSY